MHMPAALAMHFHTSRPCCTYEWPHGQSSIPTHYQEFE
jgi:hypothetical protein